MHDVHAPGSVPRHALATVVLALALLAGGVLSCDGDAMGVGDAGGTNGGGTNGGGTGGGGSPTSSLATLQVTPATADLCLAGQQVQLSIVPRDQMDASISAGAGTAAYSSSAPAVADVSSSGLVTAAAPGTAVITATFTFAGKTLSASMEATVHPASAASADLTGVYDLKTLWTFSQWGMEGTIETAVLTVQHSRDTDLLAGAFADYSMFYYADDQSPRNIPFSGSLSGSADCLGRIIIELRSEDYPAFHWRGEGTLGSEQIVGTWGEDGEGGTFTAARRVAP